MKKLISVLLSFALTFNIVGQCQTLNASAIEVNQSGQQALGQKPCKDPQNISLMAALVTVFISCLELLCCLSLGVLCYSWRVLCRFPKSVGELFAGTLSTENEELKEKIAELKDTNAKIDNKLFDLNKKLTNTRKDAENYLNAIRKCLNDEKCKNEYNRVSAGPN